MLGAFEVNPIAIGVETVGGVMVRSSFSYARPVRYVYELLANRRKSEIIRRHTPLPTVSSSFPLYTVL